MRFCHSLIMTLCAFIVIMDGCTAPTDVDAERKRTVINAPPDILRFADLPSVINFGGVRQFTAKDLPFETGNLSEKETVTITSISLKNGNQGFSLGTISLPIQLSPNSISVDIFPVRFAASNSGTFSDTIILNKSEKYYVPLYATVRRLSVKTSDADFKDVKIGQEKKIDIIVENLDSVPVTIESFDNDDVEFAFYMAPITSRTLQPGQSTSYEVTFTPSKVKTYNATIRFTIYGATDDIDNEAILTGSGIVP